MAKLAKIRLTGCHYAGMTLKHENSIFDLTAGNNPEHTLFTLKNGGGKGVMLQLIFQLLLPETRWGENDGNRVISMFYDERNNLHPFTFHVVLDWLLDTREPQHLITGIAVKPIIKHTTAEEEEKTGLAYFLYTHEYGNEGVFSVENLPLYDKKTASGVDLQDLEQFLDENKRFFTKYSQSSVRRKDAPYYTYLESRGIHRSDWLSLKSINKSEGGVTKFFAGATDNKSVFDKVIIPVISEHINNYSYEEENTLIGMFKSNLSITKDLPVLIKREADYKELLAEIRPLIENADAGFRFEILKEHVLNEGNDIYFILQEEATKLRQEIEKWGLEVKKAEEESRNLAYKQDNLIYNQVKMDLDKQIEAGRHLEELLRQFELQLEDEEAKLKLYRINELLTEKISLNAELDNKKEEKQLLIAALDLEDIKAQAAQVDEDIKNVGEMTAANWQKASKEYQAYVNYLDREIDGNRKLIRQYEDKVRVLQNEINRFALKEEDLAQEVKKLENRGFDALSLFYPENIKEDLIKNKQAEEKLLEDLQEALVNYQAQENQLGIEIKNLEYQAKEGQKEIEALESQVIAREKYELDLAHRLAKSLKQNYGGELLDHTYFDRQLNNLVILAAQYQDKLEAVRKTIWEKSLDQSLNQEDFFIPNQDVLLIKEEIKALGIFVQTGSEYLQGLNEDQQFDILDSYPGFIFGLVIANEREGELIRKNLRPDLFLHSMVPIYMRTAMRNEGALSFKSLRGKAEKLVKQEVYFEWRAAMAQELGDLASRENELISAGQILTGLKEELNILAKTDTALIISQRIKEKTAETEHLRYTILSLETEKLALQKSLIQTQADLKKALNNKQEIDKDIEQIQRYIERFNEVENQRLIINKVEEEQKTYSTEIKLFRDKSHNWQNNLDKIRNAYGEWQAQVNHISRQVKSLVDFDFIDDTVSLDYISPDIPALLLEADKLLSLLDARQALAADMNSKNSRIAVIDEQLKHLQEKIRELLKLLLKMDEKGEEYPYLALSLNELQIRIDEAETGISQLKAEKDRTKSQYDRTMGSISSQKGQLEEKAKQIQREHQRPAAIEEIDDIINALDKVGRDISTNRKFMLHAKITLSDFKEVIFSLDLNISKLADNQFLDVTKGKLDEVLKQKLKQNIDGVVEEWQRKYAKNQDSISKTIEEAEDLRTRFIKRAEIALAEQQLKDKIISSIKEAKMANFVGNRDSFSSMENHFQQELNRLSKDKSQAEEVMHQWTHRASIQVLRMVSALKDMVASMNYTNEQNYTFPLVKLRGVDRLPRSEAEIKTLLSEYFIQTITKVINSYADINSLSEQELKSLMGEQIIFAKALQGRYPTLLVYKMSENNEFRYARARDEYYVTWEAINKGEGYSPEGSGGQTLAVNTFVIMMLISFKNKYLGNETPSTVLIMDNPFGKASSRHVLDPIFEIANKLNFQLICLASPDIIKVGISERFPIFWELRLEKGKVVHGGRVIKEI